MFSTKVHSQTTLEEYNYVTKGYHVQLTSGLDMKKGYEFEDIDKKGTKCALLFPFSVHSYLPFSVHC